MHGVVAGAEEHPAPQIGDPVRPPLGDPDQTAAGPDPGQLLVAHGVRDADGQGRQQGEGEQGLQGARGRQPAVRLVRGEHLARVGVRHQPRQRRDARELRRPGERMHLSAGPVQQRGTWDRRGPGSAGRVGVEPLVGDRGGGRERQQSGRAEHARGHKSPGRKSDLHTAKLGTESPRTVLPGPVGALGHPDGRCPGRHSPGSVGWIRRRNVALSGVSRRRSRRVSRLVCPSRV